MNSDFLRGAAALSFILGVISAVYYYVFSEENTVEENFSSNQVQEVEENESEELTEEIQRLEETILSMQEEINSGSPDNSSDQDDIHRVAILEINSGMNLEEISERLVQLQMIEESQDLKDAVRANDLAQNIQIGTYEINDTMSPEEIAHLIADE
ncbi:hypothetical protein [Alkalicoccus daliensis]|uniref:YceG-like family protein n=1 Tax=Alkalicoccus daliensis TaxID=745820 RepID=A0A1H0B8N3_9BACI|nr:hypothetical protein [Alkalicoccus daliensis]SDN42014.1 hypothetical protein SAMN04488053_101797 [Alkalicoccus daliensis]